MQEEGFDFRPGDIRDTETLITAIRGQDLVYNLIAAFRKEGIPLQEFWDINVKGTQSALKAVEAAKVDRLVHISSTGVYGRMFDPPVDEDHPCNPNPKDHYQVTKRAGELEVLKAIKARLPGRVSIVRPTAIYGPDDTRLLKVFRPLQKGYFVFPGSGNIYYHPTYIDDVTQGLELVGLKREAAGRIYQIAGPKYYNLRDYFSIMAQELNVPQPKLHVPLGPLYGLATVWELVCRQLRIEPVLFRRRVSFFRDHRAFNLDRAKRELGYSPKVDVAEGLRKTIAWTKAQGLLH
jgi:nucleoside-diphosphate-sugar epimerase